MKPRTVLKAVVLATMPLLLAAPAQAAAPEPPQASAKEGIIAAPGKLLGNAPPKTSKLDAADQKLLPTDIYKPTRPATEQDGVKFHNVDVVSFLPGVVDESF